WDYLFCRESAGRCALHLGRPEDKTVMVRLRYLKILLGGWILVLLIVCGLAAPFLAPFDPQEQRLESPPQPPTRVGGQVATDWVWNRQPGSRYFEPDHLWLADLALSGRDDGRSCRPYRLFFGSHCGILRSRHR